MSGGERSGGGGMGGAKTLLETGGCKASERREENEMAREKQGREIAQETKRYKHISEMGGILKKGVRLDGKMEREDRHRSARKCMR